MVLEDGTQIEARLTGDLAIGSKAVLSLRPERVMVGDSGPNANTFNARIEELIYFGDHTKLRLSLGGSSGFMARTSFKDGLRDLQRGASIPVSWSRDCGRALPFMEQE